MQTAGQAALAAGKQEADGMSDRLLPSSDVWAPECFAAEHLLRPELPSVDEVGPADISEVSTVNSAAF